MILPKTEIILRVDFNDVDENGIVPASMSLDVIGALKPRVGDWVWLVDEEGPNCLGLVARIDGELIEVKPFGLTMRASVQITEGYQGSAYPSWPSEAKTKGGVTVPSLA